MYPSLVSHPSGRIEFGILEGMRARGFVIPAGKILLQHGRHTGANRGFGAAHIWAEHSKEMEKVGFYCYENVADFVATIVRAGTPVYFGDHNWAALRVMAVRSQTGTAIVEYRQPRGDEPFWSIVTAYTGTRTHGVRVGAVR